MPAHALLPTRRRRLDRLLALLLLFAAAPLAALPVVEKAVVEVDADRTAYPAGGAGQLAMVMHIEDGWHVNSHQPTYDYLIPTALAVGLPAGWSAAELSYPPAELGRFTFAEEELSVYQGQVAIVAGFAVPAAAEAGEVPVTLSLTYQACNDTQCLPPVTHRQTVALRIGEPGQPVGSGYFGPGGGASRVASADGGTAAPSLAAADHGSPPPAAPEQPAAAPATGAVAASPPTTAATLTGTSTPRRLGWMLALAFLGGLILNAMPCVLPVLSIKVFGLVKSAALSRRDVTVSSLATSLGILVSFWGLAAAAILARTAGAAVGWGVQFQEPAFVAALTVIVVLFSLNMWGLFEVRLPGRLAAVAGGGPQEGVAGHFATGLFATLMATPCSAPFLGPALGFALTQPATVVLAAFTAIGLGMASPYLLLAIRPDAARLLPRPGMWMVRLKEIMGFLLAGAAVWLLYVLSRQVSAEALAFFELAILALCLVVFLGRNAPAGLAARLATVAAIAAAALAVWVAATAPPAAVEPASAEAGDIAWVPFDRARAESLAAAGTPVFVDVTADWCVTCKVNERLVLNTPPVIAAFTAGGVVPMRADWTNRDRGIGEFLAEHGRYGIPFYVLYRPGGERHVFPELLTRDAVLAALEPRLQAAAR